MKAMTNTNNVTVYPCGELLKEFAQYNKIMLKKADIDSYTFEKLNSLIAGGGHITVIANRYEKQGRKNFPSKPTETETREIDAREYACYISSLGYFGDKIYKSYTYCGYIPTRLTCISPDGEIKIERIFKIEN